MIFSENSALDLNIKQSALYSWGGVIFGPHHPTCWRKIMTLPPKRLNSDKDGAPPTLIESRCIPRAGVIPVAEIPQHESRPRQRQGLQIPLALALGFIATLGNHSTGGDQIATDAAVIQPATTWFRVRATIIDYSAPWGYGVSGVITFRREGGFVRSNWVRANANDYTSVRTTIRGRLYSVTAQYRGRTSTVYLRASNPPRVVNFAYTANGALTPTY